MSYDNECKITYMGSGSQHNENPDAIATIEAALAALRRQQHPGRGGHGGRGPGPLGEPGHHDGAPADNHDRHGPFGHGGPGHRPWGDGPPPWMHRGGPHGRPIGGAARIRLLAVLLAADGTGMSISQIAEAVGVDQPRASRLVNESAERGLVNRAVDPADARRSVVTLTAAGRGLFEKISESNRSAVTQALAGFSAEETAQFAALLSRFVRAWPAD